MREWSEYFHFQDGGCFFRARFDFLGGSQYPSASHGTGKSKSLKRVFSSGEFASIP